jgi:hypothetical protein
MAGTTEYHPFPLEFPNERLRSMRLEMPSARYRRGFRSWRSLRFFAQLKNPLPLLRRVVYSETQTAIMEMPYGVPSRTGVD